MRLLAHQHKEELPQNVPITKMADIFYDHLLEDIEEGDNQTPPTVMSKNKR